MHRSPRRLAPALVVLLVAACSSGEPARSGPRIALTHQWSVPAGASIFVENSLGTAPAAAADALMKAMPNVVYRLGERCKGEAGFAEAGALTVELTLEGQKASDVRVDPQSPATACVQAGIAEEVAAEAALAGAGKSSVVLHLGHAPAPR